MKPVISFILSMTLALSGYAVYAASEPVKSSTQASQTAVASKKAPSFLFVIQAKQGEIKKNKAGQYELVLNKSDVNHIIMFSDRPYRIVKYITGKNLADDWSVGRHSFKADPPNAVLSGAGMKAEIVILSSIHVKDKHISFGLQGYTGGSVLIGGITVVIDPVGIEADPSSVSLLNRLAAQSSTSIQAD